MTIAPLSEMWRESSGPVFAASTADRSGCAFCGQTTDGPAWKFRRAVVENWRRCDDCADLGNRLATLTPAQQHLQLAADVLGRPVHPGESEAVWEALSDRTVFFALTNPRFGEIAVGNPERWQHLAGLADDIRVQANRLDAAADGFPHPAGDGCGCCGVSRAAYWRLRSFGTPKITTQLCAGCVEDLDNLKIVGEGFATPEERMAAVSEGLDRLDLRTGVPVGFVPFYRTSQTPSDERWSYLRKASV